MSDVMLSGNDGGGGGGGSHVYPSSQQSGGGGNGESEHPLQQLRFDVLDANSQGIYLTQCQNYDEAERVLVEIYNAISEAEKDVRRVAAVAAEGTEHDSADDDVARQLIDQLKATTLNNISFVVYHKGLFRQAIAHLEAAQELERKWGIQSGVSAVNACVLYNAVGQYAVASQYALQGIDILRRDAVAAASTGQTSDERSKLWGAAWHNLAVAQLQLADPTSALENSNVLYMFENSMGACQELLGKSHPMTKAVTETYRIMRKELLARGAYKPHIHNKTATANDTPRMHTYYGDTSAQSGSRKSPYTGKRMGPSTLRGNERKENKQLSVVLLSQDRTRYVEKVEAEPFHKPTSNSARRPPTGGSMSSANGRMVVHSGAEGGGVVVDPSEAVLNSKIICRRLMQGLPSGPEVGANKYTPSSSSGRASHSMQQFRRQSLANASASSPDGNKAYLQKQGLQGVSLRGNLALAGTLYANPHPLTGGTSPRGGGKMRSHNSNNSNGGGYIPLPPPSAGNNGSLMMGTSPRRSVLPPPPGHHRPFPPSTGKSSVRLPHLTPSSISNAHHQTTSSSRTVGTPPTTANNNAYTNNSTSTPMSGTITHVSEGGSMMVPRPPASPPQHSSRHELLMGDMWVEAPVHAPSPQGSSYSSPDVRASGGGVGGSGGAAAYHQQLYSIDDDDRVVDPSRFAHPV